MGILNIDQSELRYKVRFFLGSYRRIYHVLYYLKNGRTKNIVSRKTDIVLEGFPRSGNSHLYNLVMTRSNSDINIASHLHVIAQLSHALFLGKPIVVIVRNPIDCILSLLMMQPNISFGAALKNYIRYYEYVMQICDKVIVIDFDVIKNNPHLALEKIRNYLNLDINVNPFDRVELDQLALIMKKTNKLQAFNNPLTYGLPNTEKNERKLSLKKNLSNDIAKEASQLAAADDIYRKLVKEKMND